MFRLKLLNCFKRVLRQNIVSRLGYYAAISTLVFIMLYSANDRFNKFAYINVRYQTISQWNLTTNKTKVKMRDPGTLKHILLWTDRSKVPFVYFGEGTSEFEARRCKWTNCYVTGERYLFGNYSKFDIVVFNGPQLKRCLNMDDLPLYRSPHQKYVFANIEAAANYRMCSNIWNGYFNWTWTYKLNSDGIWGYFVIKNASNHVIGPAVNVPWINFDRMDPIDNALKTVLKTKNQAAAWFVSNCLTISRREEYVKNIRTQLAKYNLTVDIFGDCGELQCPKEIMNRCLKLIQNKYYFYFAFENAFSEDYVTEKVLHALNYNTVPVVLGGANYSRFLPPGSYLDAQEMGPEKLAKVMNDAIQNPTLYHKFFKWKKYYSFHLRHESPSTDDYCNFCAMANDERLMKTTSIYEDFDSWWKYLFDCVFAK